MKICKCGGERFKHVPDDNYICRECGRVNQYTEEEDDSEEI